MKWSAIVTKKSESDCFVWLNEYLKNQNINNSLNLRTIESAEELMSVVEEEKLSADCIRFASDLYEASAQLYELNPLQALTLKVGDCLSLTDGGWWIRSYTFQALNHLISKYGSHINLDGGVLIIGQGGFARLCASAFIRIGFKKITLASLDQKKVLGLAADLERSYFGIKVTAVPSEQLILLPGTHTVMVNTLKPDDKSDPLLSELYYFNFLKHGGMVWDLNFTSVDSQLSKEAIDVGAFTLNGIELTSLTDMLWLKDIFSIDIDLKNYQEFLVSKIS